MSISLYRTQIERLEKEINRLRKQVSTEDSKEASKLRKILDIERSITKHTPQSTARLRFRRIETLRKDLTGIAEKRARISKTIASKSTELARKRESLQREISRQQEKERKAQQTRERQLQRELHEVEAKTVELESELAVTLDIQAILAEVFVLESETAMKQGTCFNLAGVGLVTCEHVLGPDLTVFHPSNITKRHQVEVISSNPTADLAKICAPGLQLGVGLPLGSADALAEMDRILLAGYPNYREGDTGRVAAGSVAGFRTVSGIRRVLIDTPVIRGNSGGPVLSSTGEVVGIAVTGADRMEDAGETENHGVIPTEALAFV